MNVLFFLLKFPEQYTLTINLVGSSIKGKVNEANTSAKFAINLDLIRKLFLIEILIKHLLLVKKLMELISLMELINGLILKEMK